MNDIIFGYFTATNSKEEPKAFGYNPPRAKGYVCVAIKRPPKGSTQTEYTASFSFCSPLDQLNKKKARQISTGRLNSGREGRTVTFTFNRGEKLLFKELFQAALEAGKAAGNFPWWLTDCLDENYCDVISYGR